MMSVGCIQYLSLRIISYSKWRNGVSCMVAVRGEDKLELYFLDEDHVDSKRFLSE